MFYICKEKLEDKYANDKNYRKVRDHCHYTGECRGAANSIFILKYNIKKFLHFFHTGSIYVYHFIIKELTEEFEGQVNCLGENTEKYIIFLVPVEKEVTRIDKKEIVHYGAKYMLYLSINLIHSWMSFSKQKKWLRK